MFHFYVLFAEKFNIASRSDSTSRVATTVKRGSMSSQVKDDGQTGLAGKDAVRSKGPVSSGEMDARLEMCFLNAIKYSVKESELPLLANTFYKTHMTKYCPAGEHLEIKKSSYKTFSKFLKKQEKAGLINVKMRSKGGGECIVRVDKSHNLPSDMHAIGDTNKTEATTEDKASTVATAVVKASAAGTTNRPVFTEMFEVTSDTLPVFGRRGFKEGDVLNESDVRQIINDYLDERNLSHDDFDYFLDKLNYKCEIRTNTGRLIQKKGDFRPIKIDIHVMDTAPYRQTTVVEKLDEFGIKLSDFCDTVHKKLSCGASIMSPHTDSTLGKIRAKVVVQGNQIDSVGDILINEYGVPRKLLTLVIPDEYQIVEKVISKEELSIDKKRQNKLKNVLCITGIAEHENENLKELVMGLARDLNVGICVTDIDACGRRGNPRPGREKEIVVEFACMSVRQDLFMKRGHLRKMEAWDGVHINEDLTPYRREVIYHARQYKRAKLIKSVFSEDGNVFVIDNSGRKHMIIAAVELTVFGELVPPEPKLKRFNFKN